VRRLPAATTRLGELPRWEVSYGGEATGWVVIGWIEEQRLRGARNPFFFATAVHPSNGRVYRLEGNIDFDERVNVIADFHLDPMTSRQHLGLDMIGDHPATPPTSPGTAVR
jgi:hypothetical protein